MHVVSCNAGLRIIDAQMMNNIYKFLLIESCLVVDKRYKHSQRPYSTAEFHLEALYVPLPDFRK